MSLINKIIFSLLLIPSFSCQTQLEKQGWQRTTVVSQLDTSTIRKDKELVVKKLKIKVHIIFGYMLLKKILLARLLMQSGGCLIEFLIPT